MYVNSDPAIWERVRVHDWNRLSENNRYVSHFSCRNPVLPLEAD